MNSFNTAQAIGVVAAIIMTAAGVVPATAASDRLGKFAPASSPEETIYRPECRMVQADGTWLPSGRIECDW
jgi:hypothetical protein